jgi:hypothetical protein
MDVREVSSHRIWEGDHVRHKVAVDAGPPIGLMNLEGTFPWDDFFELKLTGNDEPPLLAWPGSVYARLDDVASTLAGVMGWQGDGWQGGEAAFFILTNYFPRPEPLRMRVEHRTFGPAPIRATLTIEVEPWVSVETLTRAYLEARAQLGVHQSRQGRSHRKDQPPAALRLFTLWAFVEERTTYRQETDRRGFTVYVPKRRHTWATLCDEWNEHHPEHRYERWQKFSSDYTRARDAFDLPPDMEPESTRAWARQMAARQATEATAQSHVTAMSQEGVI